MKKIFLLLFLTATPILWASENAILQDTIVKNNRFSIDVQLRTRAEYNGGTQTPLGTNDKRAFFVNERARIGLGYQYKWLELKVALQHTGVWGQDDIKDRFGRVAMNELWTKMRWGGQQEWFAQIGRQQFSYDDERLLGGLDWNVAGNWHDAVRLGYENEEHRAHILGAYNQNGENVRGGFYQPGTGMPYRMLVGAWYHYQPVQIPVGLSVLFLNTGFEVGAIGAAKMSHMQTMGAHFTAKPANWDISASYYYQMGNNAADKKTSAMMAAARINYSVLPELQLGVGYDYMSGAGTDPSINNAFNPLYGTHHKFYGAMDYFYASPWTNNSGLHDALFTINGKPHKKVTLNLTYHYFAGVALPTVYKPTLGHELDFGLTAKLMEYVTLQAGYSFMIGTATMDYVKGGDHTRWNDWAFVSLNVNPQVFNKKW